LRRISRANLEKREKFRKKRFKKKLARKSAKYSNGTRRPKKSTLDPVYIKAPEVFSLTRNYDECVRCLKRLKDAVFDRRRKGDVDGPIFLDLANIRELHHAAAMVLAAELDRWRRLRGVKLRPQSLDDWKSEVLKIVYDIGIFELLEIQKDVYEEKLKAKKINTNSGDVALRIISDNTNDREPTDRLASELLEKVPQFQRQLTEVADMALSTALAEASLNSVHHAYENVKLKYPVDGRRWWAAAVYVENRSVVKFFVYDQGVGIARTLPKTDFGKALLNKVYGRKNLPPIKTATESQLIVAAFRGGHSATRKDNRGKGFPQITQAVADIGGKLRVISGRGVAIYTSGRAHAEPTNALHLGGTLLEWTFQIGDL